MRPGYIFIVMIEEDEPTEEKKNGMRSVSWKNGLATMVAHACFGVTYLSKKKLNLFSSSRRLDAIKGPDDEFIGR
ncbi:hypothetical protein JTB14_022032 [Gonioctena quinquepunctata]|nr:hypothetical protein JTB14_022032 [Gonioctena quinquepunctata]